MLAAHLEILGRKGNRWHVGTIANGQTEDELLADAEKAGAYYQSAEYLHYNPDAQIHVSKVSRYCDTCQGTGSIPKSRGLGRKACPDCKGKHSDVVLYRDDIRITWPE